MSNQELHTRLAGIEHASVDLAKDLAGYATQAAIATLVTNWKTAAAEAAGQAQPLFSVKSLEADINEVIQNLERLKVATITYLSAEEALSTMRAVLGLTPVESVPASTEAL